ncbi:uncharacterized protein LOC113238185 [Hyposmocoma kahamanoa]|uniref:uncharacterized protein LOC113238185 n=1 Tax=Hyposmocoma kahamanoa TaxID=1477025 RepID=UPI000E6D7C18|nr:uncharacterized protein LOC113238185 [Hyposmocoma kahamanoa]
MISNKSRETRRARMPKMSKNIERLYKESKCNECSVVVTRMDFAKILGKFTKVKIQYESSALRGKKNNQQVTSPNSRLKSNENGMVLIHRKAYNQHPVKELLNSKATKGNETPAKSKNALKENSKISAASTPRQSNNILKENNRIKKIAADEKNGNLYFKNVISSNLKTYGIVFVKPLVNNSNDHKSKLSLADILPSINASLLPSEEWCIDYLPKNGEPKEDKVYDRIAAELEDLMNNETSAMKSENKEVTENKDDFPSIMDILNENTSGSNPSNSQSDSMEFKSNLESSDDVEAILLGKSNDSKAALTPMEVDNPDMTNLMDVVQMNTAQEAGKLPDTLGEEMDNPHSPSILDEALQKGIEEHLPAISDKVDPEIGDSTKTETSDTTDNSTAGTVDKENKDFPVINLNTVTHVVFKRISNGVCYKSVTCPKNLKYSVELEGKFVEFLGAPKFISSLEDLQVLLQIVHESDLDSLYVLH